MKYIITLFLILIIILTGGYYLLFTASGNDKITPYINNYISKKIPKYTKVRLNNFRLTPTRINANITINDSLNAKIIGDFALTGKKFDLDYRLFSKRFKVKNFVMQDKLDLIGKIKGDIEHIFIEGSGKAINSDVSYTLEIDKKIIKDIQIDIEKGNLKSLLLLTGQKPFASGELDLYINMPKLDSKNPIGDAKLVLHQGTINSDLIYKEFNITLPDNFTYQANLKSKLKNNYATLDGDIKTTLANLFLKNSKVYYKDKKLLTDYQLVVKELSKLESLIGKKLKGELNIIGKAMFDKTLMLAGYTKSFGGKIDFTLKDSKVDATLKGVPLTKIMHTLIYPEVFESAVFGDIEYNFISKRGEINAELVNARFLPNKITTSLKEYAKVDLIKEKYNQTTFTADLDANEVLFDFKAKSDKSYISILDAKFLKSQNKIDAKFDINIDEKDFSGTIKGDILKPRVKLDTSQYLKTKIIKEVDKFIDEKISDKTKQKLQKELEKIGTRDLNVSKKAEEELRGLFRNLFN